MLLPISRTHLLGLLSLSLAATSVAAQSLLPTQGQVVAAVGDAPIGTPAGATIGNSGPFESPIIDQNGAILFRARLIGGPITGNLDDRALFYGRTANDLQLIAQSGGPDPSGTFPGATLNSTSSTTGLPLATGLPSSYRINNGFILYGAALNGGGLIYTPAADRNDTMIFWGPATGPLSILAQRHVTTMAGGAVLDSTFSSPSQQSTALGSDGEAIFYSVLGDFPTGTTDVTSNNNGAWIVGTPGALNYLIRKADTLLGGDVAIGTIGSNCQRNDAGWVLHDETLSTVLGNVPATAATDKIVLISEKFAPGVYTHHIVMREGEQAAGMPAGALYGTPTIAQGFSNSAKTAFTCTMTGAVTTADDLAVWEASVANVLPIMREGDPVPGTSHGETFAIAFSGTLSYSDATGAAFVGTMNDDGSLFTTTANDAAVFAGHSGSLQMIVREGDAAPGTTGVFGSINASPGGFGSGTQLTTNEHGQLTILCNVVDGGVQYVAYYTYDPLHGLQLQLLGNTSTGADNFGVNPNTQGVTNITAPIGFAASGGSVLGLDNQGDFVCRPFFTGGSLSAIVRGHIGSLQGTPSAVPVTGGVPHVMSIDCTAAHAFEFYIVLASGLGSSPGFPNPLNPALNVPLVPGGSPDWFQLSFDLANSVVWGNTLFITDAAGKATATFTMPPGYPMFQGTTLHHAAALFDFSLFGTFVTEAEPCYLY